MNQPASSGLRRRLRPLVVVTSLMALATMMTMAFSLPPFARPAQAALTAVGPVDPVSTLPQRYPDANGLRLQGCMTPGTCATILPNPALPPSFPDNWPAETFYWNATANITTGRTGKTRLILATEAVFPNGVVAGQGTAISRIRVVISSSGLVPGATYKVTEPYGVDTLTGDA